MAEISEMNGDVCEAFSGMFQEIEKDPGLEASYRTELKSVRIFMTVRNNEMQEIISGKLDQTSWGTWATYYAIPVAVALAVTVKINIVVGLILGLIGSQVAGDKLGEGNRYSRAKAELLVNRSFKELGFGRFNPNDIVKCMIELEISRVNYIGPTQTKTYTAALGNQETKNLFF